MKSRSVADTKLSAFVGWRLLYFGFFYISRVFGRRVISPRSFLFLTWACLSEKIIKPTANVIDMLDIVIMKEVKNIL